jgi:glycosyltransferase domain-containing protein
VGHFLDTASHARAAEGTIMQDFTIVVPTHNRPQQLAALLAYLEAEQADCRIIVIDSSRNEVIAVNRERVRISGLHLQYIALADEPQRKKWRKGVHAVSTQYCALCADDDLIVLDGVRRCLQVLRDRPDAAVVQGRSFSFQAHENGDVDLNNVVYFTPTIEDAQPLARLAKLFKKYQTPTYGVFRTGPLQRILDLVEPVQATLARELLRSALTAVEGPLIRLPCFSYGRSMSASEPYENWHPLEWICKDADGLFGEYVRYREVLRTAVLQRPDNTHSAEEVGGILDLIHLHYLLEHAPAAALGFITEQEMNGALFADYWPQPEIHDPLWEAAGIGTADGTFGPVTILHGRRFALHPNFYAPADPDPPQVEDILGLVDTLKNYHLPTDNDGVGLQSR